MRFPDDFSVGAGFHASLVMVGKSRGFPPGNDKGELGIAFAAAQAITKASKTFSPCL
jgi:hypothetical protein